MTPSECENYYEETGHTAFYATLNDKQVYAKIMVSECGYPFFRSEDPGIDVDELEWYRW